MNGHCLIIQIRPGLSFSCLPTVQSDSLRSPDLEEQTVGITLLCLFAHQSILVTFHFFALSSHISLSFCSTSCAVMVYTFNPCLLTKHSKLQHLITNPMTQKTRSSPLSSFPQLSHLIININLTCRYLTVTADHFVDANKLI